MKKLTVGSCFSGIGGLELGLEWTGDFETRWQIEIDPYASAVLRKHWPNVQRFSDITTVSNPPRVDVICGGFPCQDVSLAGARLGLEGKRSTLWSELFRLVCEVKPRWLVAENVPGLLSSDGGRFMGNILRDLAGIGFDAEWGVLSAADVGARHIRRRIFLLANPRSTREGGEAESRVTPHAIKSCLRLSQERDALANANGARLERYGNGTVGGAATHSESRISSGWETEPNVGRVAHGIPSRVDRLRCLGNAVVPQVAQRIGEMILNYEAAT